MREGGVNERLLGRLENISNKQTSKQTKQTSASNFHSLSIYHSGEIWILSRLSLILVVRSRNPLGGSV